MNGVDPVFNYPHSDILDRAVAVQPLNNRPDLFADRCGKIASPVSKPLAAITRPAISSVLSSSPIVVLNTPRQSRDNSFRAKASPLVSRRRVRRLPWRRRRSTG
jgi:hypothetical protein